MILVKQYINGQKDRIRHSTDVLARNSRYLRDTISKQFCTPVQSIIIVPLVIAGKDTPLSKNLPDILCEITSYLDTTLPTAKDITQALLQSCVDLETLHFVIALTNTPNKSGHYFHRPSR